MSKENPPPEPPTDTVPPDAPDPSAPTPAPEPPAEPVNPVQAAADLAAQAPPPAPEPAAALPLEVLPPHIITLRLKAATAERLYDDAAEEAKNAKKSWEKARETFEAAFDAEVRRQRDGQTPGLPFDGVHMADVDQRTLTNDAPPTPKGPAEIKSFPRAVPDPAPTTDEPPCQQCGDDAAAHNKPDDGPRTYCIYQEGQVDNPDIPPNECSCALYQAPPAAEPEPDPDKPTVH